MKQDSLARPLFLSACIAGAIFTAMVVPLEQFKNNVVSLEVQNQPVFSSRIQDSSRPYLVFSAGVSLAVGLGTFSLLAWRQATQKLLIAQADQADLTEELIACKTELERIKFSANRLQDKNLAELMGFEVIHQEKPQTRGGKLAEFNAYTMEPAEGIVSTQTIRTDKVALQPDTVDGQHHHFPRRHRSQHHRENDDAFEQLFSQLHQLSEQVKELRRNEEDQVAG